MHACNEHMLSADSIPNLGLRSRDRNVNTTQTPLAWCRSFQPVNRYTVLGAALAVWLSPLGPVHLSPPSPSHPPGRRACQRARSLALPRPDESSTSWRKAGTQGLSSESRNYQDRDPPTQYSNLYTYLEEPALPPGQHPWGAGKGGRGAGRLERGSSNAGCSADRTGALQGPGDPGKEKG